MSTEIEWLEAQLKAAFEGPAWHGPSVLDEGGLDQPLVPEAPYSAYTQFIGITQHDLYHAGQIAILTKARSG
jgi:hypothetical protein